MRRDWSDQMTNLAGMLTWVACGIPIWAAFLGGEGSLTPSKAFLRMAAHLAFGIVFWLVINPRFDYLTQRSYLPKILLFFQSLMASIAFLVYPDYNFIAALFVITISHAVHVLGVRQSLWLVLIQSLVLIFGFSLLHWNFLIQLVVTMGYVGFQIFALFTVHIALREAKAKEELAKVNAELKATQVLLSESSRVGERLRIARELHDLVGHQLTALTLNLEVATHTEGEKAREHVSKAQKIAKDLLSDVRGVVGSMRETQVNLETALRALVEGIPQPIIHLELVSGLTIEDPEKAHTLVRCVQEVITNTIKHAQANNLWIRVESNPEGITVHAHDDGRGSRQLRSGHGLSGMQERLEQFGGRLKVRSEPGKGFALDAVLPN